MNYLDPNDARTVEISNHVLQSVIDSSMLQVISHLKPKLSKDGNMFCYLYGEMPNDCVVGFGATAYAAMQDFCKNFYNQTA